MTGRRLRASITALALLGPPAVAAAADRLPSGPLAFEANRGQADAVVRFLGRGPGYTAFLTSSGAVLTLGHGRVVVRVTPVGADPATRIAGDGELPGVVRYVGDGRPAPISAPTYRAVRYAGVYPGIDLVYHGGPRRLEYDFVVGPGADPGRIELAIDGAEHLEVDGSGDLVAHTPAGDLRQPRPVVYQQIDGDRRPVDGGYVVDGDARVQFRIGRYDRSQPLVIDPVITYSTYLGGSNDEADYAFEGEVSVGVDGLGNTYVAGTTTSVDFPTTAGAGGQTLAGTKDLFVTKLSPTGAVLYSTYLGGPCDDAARDIAVDAAGNAYVTGRANGGQCYLDVQAGVLVAKLDPTGALVYATVFGGSLADSSIGRAIAIDTAGHAYVTGTAYSASHDFPTTSGAFRTIDCGASAVFGDGFVAKVAADGGSLLYSTFLCGSGDDVPDDIAIDPAGNAYVGGTTGSSDFPTVTPFQGSRLGGSVDVTGFVSKLSPDASHLVYSTYLGGSSSEVINGIAVDPQGNAYVTGETQSQDFPTTPGALQEHPGNRTCLELCTDAFVTKLAASGSALVYSTYLYGDLDDAGAQIAVDGTGEAIVVGTTYSSYFPILNAFQPQNHGVSDAFVAKLDANGAALVYSSYLGGTNVGPSPGTGGDDGTGLALDGAGNVYVAGYTQSFDFPTTPNAFQRRIGNGICDFFGTPCGDAFVTKITGGGPGVTPPVNLSVTPTDVAPGDVVSATWAGIPMPTPTDSLQLYTLGSTGFDSDSLWFWQTTGTAAGTVSLLVPAGLATGWYELRLLSPDPDFSNLPRVIARSAPIRIAGTAPTTTTTQPTTTTTVTPTTSTSSSTTSLHPTTTSTAHPTTTSTTTLAPSTTTTTQPTSTTTTRPPTTTTMWPTSTTTSTSATSSSTVPATATTTEPPTTSTLPTIPCESAGDAACEDGDPCTIDVCVAGVGCVTSQVTGADGVACTCRRPTPPACAGESIPAPLTVRLARACRILDDGTSDHARLLPRRRLRRATRNLKGAITAVSRAHNLSATCAAALAADLRDAKQRADRLLPALGR